MGSGGSAYLLKYYMGAIFVFFIICFAFGNCACAHIYGEESFCVRIRRAVAITLQAAAMYCCKQTIFVQWPVGEI